MPTMWSTAVLVLAVPAAAVNHGYKSSEPWLPRLSSTAAVLANELIPDSSLLPESFDWRNVNGQNLVVSDWNQHIPQYCGACWIHGTTSALNDRIKVMRKGEFPDVILGRQALINCIPAPDGDGPNPGCDGGDSVMIHKYLHEHKIPDETCLPYQAANMECTPENVCRNCLPGHAGCWAVKNYSGYGVSSYGNLSGEEQMMKEIYARGPIACDFATDMAFMLNFSENVVQNEGVYVTDQNFTTDDIDHVMEVAGWGQTASGLKYWVIRNSWGTYWGDAGWLKLRRGVNQMMSEHSCNWAVPTWDDLDNQLVGKVLGDYKKGTSKVHAGVQVQAVLAGPNWPGGSVTLLPLQTSAAMAAMTFLLGAGVASLISRCMHRRTVEKQPPLLG